jgi:hypothetical protein
MYWEELLAATASRASSHAYCARSRENSLGFQSSITVVRIGDAGASSGNSSADSCPESTSPICGDPESSESYRTPARQRGRNW